MSRFAPIRFIVRDLSFVVVAVVLWIVSAHLHDLDGAWGLVLDVATGVATLVPAALLHEWGHLAGARLGGSKVRFPDGVFAKLLFDFDVERNDRGQFLMMSFGGYAGSLLGVIVCWGALPPDRLASWIAQTGAVIGLIVSILIEFPHTLQVLRGGPIPAPLVTATKPK